MVLPLLGLLALGGLEAGRGQIAERRDRQDGVRRQKAYDRGVAADPLRRDGQGATKFNESGAIFYGGGDLSAQAFLQERYDQDLQTQAEGAQMARQQVASAPGMMNAQTNRMRLNEEVAERAQIREDNEAFYNSMVENAATPAQREFLSNTFTPAHQRGEVATGLFNAQMGKTAVHPLVQQQVDDRGQGWLALDPETQRDILGLERQINTAERTLNYMTNASVGGKVMNPGARAEIIADYATASLDFLRKRTEAGAMQQADLDLFEEMSGDPSKWTDLSNSEKGRVRSILKTMRNDLVDINISHGLYEVPGNTNLANQAIDPVTGGTLQRLEASEWQRRAAEAEAQAAEANNGPRQTSGRGNDGTTRRSGAFTHRKADR